MGHYNDPLIQVVGKKGHKGKSKAKILAWRKSGSELLSCFATGISAGEQLVCPGMRQASAG